MKFLLVAAIASLAALTSAQAPAGAPLGPPTIKWGKCPQLEPTDKDKMAKAKVLEACLKEHPAPTEELFKKDAKKYEAAFFEHQAGLASCALKKEDWVSSFYLFLFFIFIYFFYFFISSTRTALTSTRRPRRRSRRRSW